MSSRVCVELKLDLRQPAPAESAAVRGGKLQSNGLGFGARCKRPLRFPHSSRTETYSTRGGDWSVRSDSASSLVPFFQRK